MQPSPRRVLILGATGAIGSHAVRACLARGWTVRALVRPTSDLTNVDGLALELVQGDVRDPASLKHAFSGCDAFVHAAGYYPRAPFSVARVVREGLATVEHVFAAADGAGARGVYVSSLSTIGPGSVERVPDDTARSRVDLAGALVGAGRRRAAVADESHRGARPRPGAYVAAKAAMEAVACERAASGLALVVVNPTLCFGEYDRKPTSGRLILEVARGGPPAVVDFPLNLVYSGDVGLGIARALEQGTIGERYILGGTNTSSVWLLRQIAFELETQPPRIRVPISIAAGAARLRDATDRLRKRPAFASTAMELARAGQHYDTTKAARELGLTEPTPAVETVRRTVRWFLGAGMLERGSP